MKARVGPLSGLPPVPVWAGQPPMVAPANLPAPPPPLWTARLPPPPPPIAGARARWQEQLDRLPDEMLLEIFFHASPGALNQICPASQRMARLCANDRLWQAKYQRRYGPWSGPVPPSWRQEYMTRTLAPKPVYVLQHYGELIAVFEGDLASVHNRLAEILNDEDPEEGPVLQALTDIYESYESSLEESGEITLNECYEEEGEGSPDCDPLIYFAELPITGEVLGKIIKATEGYRLKKLLLHNVGGSSATYLLKFGNRLVAAFRGNLDKIYDKLAEVLNNSISDDGRLLTGLLSFYHGYYRNWDESGEITLRECYELRDQEDPEIECDPMIHLAELPISGQMLREIMDRSDDIGQESRLVLAMLVY